MRKLILLLTIFSVSSVAFGADFAEITGMTLSSGKGEVGSPVTITATTTAGADPYYYKFWANTKGFCQKPCQSFSSSHWIMLKDWSQDNTCIWTPDASGSYTLVVWVGTDSDDTSCKNIIGAGFVVGESIGAVNLNGAYTLALGEPINLDFPITLTQSGDRFSGEFTSQEYSGSVSGTIVDTATVTFKIKFFRPCHGNFTGTATIMNNGTDLSGEFTGSQDCLGQTVITCSFTKQP